MVHFVGNTRVQAQRIGENKCNPVVRFLFGFFKYKI